MVDNHASNELDALLSDARYLVSQASSMDSRIEKLCGQAHVISERLFAAKEYQKGVEQLLNASSKLDRRRALLDELQKENRMIKSYEEENSMLRDQLEKSYATLDEISSRHRSMINRVQSDAPFSHLNPSILEKVLDAPFTCSVVEKQDHIEKARKLMEVMRFCEILAQRDAALVARLAKENRSLRELLNFASLSDPHIIAHFRSAMLAYDHDILKQRNSAVKESDKREEEKEKEVNGEEAELNETHDSVSESMNTTCVSVESPANGTIRFVAAKRRPVGSNSEPKVNGIGGTSHLVLDGIDEEEGTRESSPVEDHDVEESPDSEVVNSLPESQPADPETAQKPDSDDQNPDTEVQKPDVETDSGTASSLSSSPCSSNGSDGHEEDVEKGEVRLAQEASRP